MWTSKLQTGVAVLITMAGISSLLAQQVLVPKPGRASTDAPAGPRLIRSAQSGPWSAPATWEGGKVPAAGSRVQVCTGHTVTYDLKSDRVIRSIHVAGTLRFPPDRDTR